MSPCLQERSSSYLPNIKEYHHLVETPLGWPELKVKGEHRGKVDQGRKTQDVLLFSFSLRSPAKIYLAKQDKAERNRKG
jgi:hypothetical protein